MKSSILKQLGPGTQLLMLMLLIFVSLFVMQITAFLVIRPLFGVNIFESTEMLIAMEDQESININKIIQVFYQLGMFLIPALLFAKIFGKEEKSFFNYEKKQKWNIWLVAGLFFIIAIPFVNFLHHLNLQIPLSKELVESDVKSSELISKFLGGQGIAEILINVFVFALIPAIGEELIFRGVILRQLALSTKNMHIAVWVSAAFFSFIHGEATVFIPRLLMGAALGYLYVWRGNIGLNILAHFINNVISILLINFILNDQLDVYYDTIGAHREDALLLSVSILLVAGALIYLYRQRNNRLKEFVIDEEIARIKDIMKNNNDDVIDNFEE